MQKIKQFIESEEGKDTLTVLIVILVGLASFELGRLSKGNSASGIKIEYTGEYSSPGENQAASAISAKESVSRTVLDTAANAGKKFFASTRGSKYYSVTCPAGKTIKPENRIYFATREEAEGAGYELSSSCR